jgi:hypothetical protein
MRTLSLWKRCPRCQEFKSRSEFPTRDKASMRPNAYCKPCQSEYSKDHYRQHSVKHNQRRYINSKRYRSQNRQKALEYLQAHPCVDCGEDDPVVLEFDHVRGQKVLEICCLVARASSWERIEKEIAKCEVRCANCHRRKTARDFRWWSFVQLNGDDGR